MSKDARERRSVAEVVQAVVGPLRRWFRSRGLPSHDADDCVQETVVRVLRWGARSEQHSVEASLAQHVAMGVHADYWRARNRRALEPLPDDAEAGPASRDAALDLATLMRRLPLHERVVVELSLQGHRYAEIAERLGIPEGTVKSRMYHAVRRLREDPGR